MCACVLKTLNVFIGCTSPEVNQPIAKAGFTPVFCFSFNAFSIQCSNSSALLKLSSKSTYAKMGSCSKCMLYQKANVKEFTISITIMISTDLMQCLFMCVHVCFNLSQCYRGPGIFSVEHRSVNSGGLLGFY